MCDCGDQLEMAKRIISENGKGVIIFPANHEGRGIGLTNKIRAYKVIRKNKDIDTYQANNILGFPDDCRKYDDVVKIIDDLRINKINLLSNNSEKITVLKDKIEVITPLSIRPNPHNQKYLEAKSKKQTAIDFNQITVSAYQKNYNIAIITTEWHNDLMETYCDQIKTEIQKFCDIQQIHVPGSYEIPLCASKLIASGKFDAIICTGIIVTSHGNHFEYESNAIKNTLLKMQLKYDFPIINGILNCRKFEEIQERINPKNGLAKSIALTTINMCSLQNRINTI
jgi:6,7-dimethyl-8-ribityllumazine synthase